MGKHAHLRAMLDDKQADDDDHEEHEAPSQSSWKRFLVIGTIIAVTFAVIAALPSPEDTLDER